MTTLVAERVTPVRRGTSLSRTVSVSFALFGLLLVVAGLLIALAIDRTSSAIDEQVDHYGPSVTRANALFTALVNEETGVRGFAVTADESYLAPYDQGVVDEQAASASLRAVLPDDVTLERDLTAVLSAAQAWQTQFAEPVIAATRSGDRTTVQTMLLAPEGKALFDFIRSRYAVLSADVSVGRTKAVSRLHDAFRLLVIGASVAALLVVLGAVTAWFGLRRRVISPIGRLAAESRRVAAGEYDHRVAATGPSDIVDLAADVEAMRQRVVSELEQVRAAQAEADRTSASLARSNADLEQFAYVASHDLQEPLRKVSNFCQLLERQYADDLDDRARQYIGFAVDGAKRMQILINELLSFSRVGRNSESLTPIDTGAAARAAVENLSEQVAESGASVVVDPGLPTLPGDLTLLTTLFQNLVGNAVKYRGEEPPKVTVSATVREVHHPLQDATTREWVFEVTDNGIGIEAQYAQRIFVIFQRLHLRDSYGGTGIGLAMCKKIVEYHGGTIWLEASDAPGSTFCFTLPEGTTA